MDDGNWPLSILIFLGFILMDGMLYGFGAAIQHLNSGTLEKEAGEGNKKAERLLAVLECPAEFVNTVQIVTNLIGLISGAVILRQAGAFLETMIHKTGLRMEEPWTALATAAAAVVLLAVLISLGIVIPKRLASRKPEKWAYRFLRAAGLAVLIFKPFAGLVSGLSWLILYPVGVGLHDKSDNVTEEDIMLMVNEGNEQGVLEADEAEMITNIVELGDKQAGDIMTRRRNVAALPASMTLGEAVDFILREGINSRFPVYGEDIDDIRGILHLRDAVACAQSQENRGKQIDQVEGLLRTAHFIPETRNINPLFKEMQSQKIHMEIVVDEYGQTAGIVTMEDILEEIVGNILDEYDEDEEMISRREDGSFVFDGLTPLEDVSKELGLAFDGEDSENFDTLNGFLISRLNRVPREGETPQVHYGGYLFQTISVENKVIHSVAVIPEGENGLREKPEPGADLPL